MTESLILCLLDQILPAEITRIIIMLYLTPLKTGLRFFKCSCGQMTKIPSGYICEAWTTICKPYYKREKYLCTSLDYCKLIELEEGEEEDEYYETYECIKCDKRWIETDEHDKGIHQIFQCFCRKITTQFPCGTCTAKKCAFEECQGATDSSLSILCSAHYRCKICKIPYDYYYSAPDHYGFEGYIKRACSQCKESEYYDFEEYRMEILFPDEFDFRPKKQTLF